MYCKKSWSKYTTHLPLHTIQFFLKFFFRILHACLQLIWQWLEATWETRYCKRVHSIKRQPTGYNAQKLNNLQHKTPVSRVQTATSAEIKTWVRGGPEDKKTTCVVHNLWRLQNIIRRFDTNIYYFGPAFLQEI